MRLELVGELCAYSAPLVRPDLIEAPSVRGTLVLDLNEVRFCDAAGVRLLITVRRVLEASDIGLELDRISRSVSHLLALTGSDQLFPRTPSGDDAVLATRPEPARFEIRNRKGGQVIDLTVDGELSTDVLEELERRLLRLISVRQPSELNLDLRSSVEVGWPTELSRAQDALAEVGGVLIVRSGPAVEHADPLPHAP